MFLVNGKNFWWSSHWMESVVNARLQSKFHFSFVTSPKAHFSEITGVLPKMIFRRVSLLMHWLAFMERKLKRNSIFSHKAIISMFFPARGGARNS